MPEPLGPARARRSAGPRRSSGCSSVRDGPSARRPSASETSSRPGNRDAGQPEGELALARCVEAVALPLGRRDAALHLAQQPAGLAVLAGGPRRVDGPAPVVVAPGQPALGAPLVRPAGFRAPSCRFCEQPVRLVAGVLVLRPAGGALGCGRRRGLRVAAGPQRRRGRLHHQAAAAEPVQQLAVVADQQADAVVSRQRRREHLARRGVEVVCRLVDGEHRRFPPQRDGDLGALALAVAQALPALEPVGLDRESPLQAAGRPVGGGEKRGQLGRRVVGALGAVDCGRGRRDGPGRRGQLACGQQQQRRLAAPVRPDDSRPARGQVEREILEERLRRRLVAKREAGHSEHHGVPLGATKKPRLSVALSGRNAPLWARAPSRRGGPRCCSSTLPVLHLLLPVMDRATASLGLTLHDRDDAVKSAAPARSHSRTNRVLARVYRSLSLRCVAASSRLSAA